MVIPVLEKVYQWQRFLRKDLGGCELKNQQEVAELKTRLSSLAEENKEQKRLLSAPLPKNWQFLTVKVIGLTNEELTINAGQKDGVATGMIAVSGETYLGRVGQVSEHLAKIRLPSFFEEKLSIKIVSVDKMAVYGKGLLVGYGQGKMKIEQILSSERVSKGNLIITSMAEGELLIGEIEEVIKAKGEVFQMASIKRLFNPEELNTIFLMRGKI